jgi:hypothetical protein
VSAAVATEAVPAVTWMVVVVVVMVFVVLGLVVMIPHRTSFVDY